MEIQYTRQTQRLCNSSKLDRLTTFSLPHNVESLFVISLSGLQVTMKPLLFNLRPKLRS